MLKQLSYKAEFSATGRVLNATLSFEKGTTAITGPNESGKSFVIEMVRWCLFGAGALRGKRDDYKTLKATLDVSIKGVDYRIERTLSNAKVLCDETPIAVGTSPVNQKIISILGFDLTVFDVACAANQSEVTKLGDMSPTERKRMVDQTIGLDRLDEIQKWAAEQRLMLGREVEVLKKGVVEPTEPPTPAGYEPSYLLEVKLKELRALKAELDQLHGWLQHSKAEPTLPPRPDVTATEEELAAADASIAEIRHISSLPVVDFDVNEVREQWEAYDLYMEQKRFIAAHPFPTMTLADVDAARKGHEVAQELQRLEAQLKRLLASPEVTCPSCDHHFRLADAEIASIRTRIASLGEAAPADLAALDREEARLNDWGSEATLKEWGRLQAVPPMPPPAVPRSAPMEGITTAERDRRLAAVPSFRARNEIVSELSALRTWEILAARHEEDLAAYQEWLREKGRKEARAAELMPVVEALPGVEALLKEAQGYERDLASYREAKVAFDAKVEEIEAKSVEYHGWKNVTAVLTEVRSRVKTYLVPSLSKVASHLLAQMTGGQRSSIVVDENFDIMVDGQRLDTLSGSGKACANLALRIGLGQVLTNNVLSLFIGDEIDASMDADRAEFTQNSLGSLSDLISQIILVTHKIPTAEKVVRLEG